MARYIIYSERNTSTFGINYAYQRHVSPPPITFDVSITWEKKFNPRYNISIYPLFQQFISKDLFTKQIFEEIEKKGKTVKRKGVYA